MACGILFSWPGIESVSPALKPLDHQGSPMPWFPEHHPSECSMVFCHLSFSTKCRDNIFHFCYILHEIILHSSSVNIQQNSVHYSPRWLSGKESACRCRRCKRRRFSPWVQKIPWKRKWQPTPVFFPGKFYGQRSLTDYSPWGCKE